MNATHTLGGSTRKTAHIFVVSTCAVPSKPTYPPKKRVNRDAHTYPGTQQRTQTRKGLINLLGHCRRRVVQTSRDQPDRHKHSPHYAHQAAQEHKQIVPRLHVMDGEGAKIVC